MAEISNNSTHSHADHKPGIRRVSTRVDLTPMVDLGFLLITFFMLTTSLAKPHIMALVMPDQSNVDVDLIKNSKVLTLLLGDQDKIYWYEGIDNVRLDSTTYSSNGLRSVILNKMDKVKNQWGYESYQDIKTGEARQGSYLYVLIKPMQGSRYLNLVDVLDEMAICGVRYYTILDISDPEIAFVKNPVAGLDLNEAAQRAAAFDKRKNN